MFKKLLLVLLLAIALPLGLSTPAQAWTAEHAYVNVEVDRIRSQSNVLISFQKVADGAITQGYICDGLPPYGSVNCVAGEGGQFFQGYEPQRVWANPGWCLGVRYYIDTDTSYGSWTTWKYYYGGSGGQSVPVHPGDAFAGTWIIQTFLSQNC
jgi:hypothetical protein